MVNKKIGFGILAAIMLASCGTNSTNKSQDSDNKTEVKQNIIQKSIPVITEFTHLTNIGGIDIDFEEGDYKIVAEGDSALVSIVRTEFDSNLLTVTMPYDSNVDINVYEGKTRVKLYISAPNLQCVSLCGNGSFIQHGLWKQENISLGHLSSSTLSIDSIECSVFRVENSSTGTLNFNNINGRNLTFFTRGAKGSVSANVDADTLYISNIGSENLNYTGKYKKKLIDNPSAKQLVDNTQMNLQ